MSEKKIILLALYVHPDKGIEIELPTNASEYISVVSLIGILEQIKFDLLKSNDGDIEKKTKTNYDA
jgi:hypothetical protein